MKKIRKCKNGFKNIRQYAFLKNQDLVQVKVY